MEKDSGSIYGYQYYNYTGESTVKLEVVNQSGVKFENVTIVCELYTFVDFKGNDPLFGWEFKMGNQQTLTNSRVDSKNYKRITITLPYDGNWSTTEDLELTLYTSAINILMTPHELSDCYLRIASVSGTIEG